VCASANEAFFLRFFFFAQNAQFFFPPQNAKCGRFYTLAAPEKQQTTMTVFWWKAFLYVSNQTPNQTDFWANLQTSTRLSGVWFDKKKQTRETN
jgi:hypothetical protein